VASQKRTNTKRLVSGFRIFLFAIISFLFHEFLFLIGTLEPVRQIAKTTVHRKVITKADRQKTQAINKNIEAIMFERAKICKILIKVLD